MVFELAQPSGSFSIGDTNWKIRLTQLKGQGACPLLVLDAHALWPRILAAAEVSYMSAMQARTHITHVTRSYGGWEAECLAETTIGGISGEIARQKEKLTLCRNLCTKQRLVEQGRQTEHSQNKPRAHVSTIRPKTKYTHSTTFARHSVEAAYQHPLLESLKQYSPAPPSRPSPRQADPSSS